MSHRYKIIHFNLQRYIVYSCILLSFTACVNYKSVQFKSIEKINFSLENDGSGSSFQIRIHNPNAAGLKLRYAEANFVFQEKPLGKAKLSRSIFLAANSESNIPFKLALDKNNLPALIPAGLGIIFGDSSKQIRVYGSIRVRKFLWYKKYNFDLSKKIDLDLIKSLKLN